MKFFPDKENRKLPKDRVCGENNENKIELLKLRNELRLYYRNWIDVWRTYHYGTRYILAVGIIIGLVFQSYIVTGIIALFWPVVWYFTKKKMKELDSMAMLISGFLDSDLDSNFGSLLPFSDDYNFIKAENGNDSCN
jgi:hypothetical protein